jgi:hypothetical protein
VPIFFGSGSKDAAVPAATVKQAYDETVGTLPKVYAELKGANHHEPASGPDHWKPYTINWFNCHLKHSDSDCAIIYGSNEDSMCSQPKDFPTK